MNKVNVVGIGPGHKDYILPMAYKIIEESDVIIGGKRNLDIFESYNKDVYLYNSNLSDMCDFINTNKTRRKLTVIVSGDTGFYSLLDYLQVKIGKEYINVVPGISSYQYLFSKIGKSYKDYGLYSLHGREIKWIEKLKDKKGVFLLTDKKNSPDNIAKQLIEKGLYDIKMIVGENLSYDDEKITIDIPENIMIQQFSALSVVVIENNG
ncbi:precorrin-6y C5,15-methyltransferase (decarboxylating) subunit CbiE [Vallitalea longa]|uniref:Precorrin-6y C5,15-methyltransferase (Decarboxylating) subunit CbiE n=1 Tax=Vallitalea longa TaxID=2936439 RepID=A0A9W5YG39_9FIRM|nr:precorrin-6y C5,15-methyltransferase (decarboxylating) subunit CbiE [Vallitalea longa]GKX31284.1 precorrin-6y C5,15-methyltransferase (decarboxylating) subunit CbiE [Vallitalea longa]